MSVEHKNIGADGIHIAHSWKVNELSELDTVTVIESDLDKLALVGGIYYRLSQLSPNVWSKVQTTKTSELTNDSDFATNGDIELNYEPKDENIQEHIVDTTIHYPQSEISITESQISDLKNYELADNTILKDADIGVTLQGYNVNTVVDANYVHTDNNFTTTEKTKLSNALTSETVTTISLVGNVLRYTAENGVTTEIDVSMYLDDTNLARIISGVYVPANKVLRFTRDDNTTFDIDASMFFDDTNLVTSVNGQTGAVTIDLSGYELLSNKKTDIEANKTSDTFFASVKAIYNWATGLFIKKVTMTDNAIVRANGTGGDVQGSGLSIDDNGIITGSGITQSATDTTAGRLLKVGDFGMGGNVPAITHPVFGTNLNNYVVSGAYFASTDGEWTNAPTQVASAGTLVVIGYSDRIKQEFKPATQNRIFVRTLFNTWTPWREIIITDDNGNVGIGVTPSNWDASTYGALQVKKGSLSSGTSGTATQLMNNAFYALNGYMYVASSQTAERYVQNAGTHSWFTAPVGTAGNPITWNNVMSINNDGELTVPSIKETTAYKKYYTKGAGTAGIDSSILYPLFPATNDTLTLGVGTYKISMNFYFIIEGSTVSASVRLNMKGGGTAVGNIIATTRGNASNGGNAVQNFFNSSIETTQTVTSTTSVTSRIYTVNVEGMIDITTAGTIIPSYTFSSTLTGGTVVFSSGNHMVVEKISNSTTANIGWV
jgi:hypothetical protein